MKYEVKICLLRYKIAYSLAFILVLCVIHPMVYYNEIGAAIEKPVALLAVVFCADTYLAEIHGKRREVFRLYSLKRQSIAIFQRLFLQTAYLFMISCIGFFAFFWQRPVSLSEDITVPAMFGTFCLAMLGTVLLWSVLSVVVSILFCNMWAAIGLLFVLWIGLISTGGKELLGKWNPFSYSFCEPANILLWEWLGGKVVSSALATGLLFCIPKILKKRG